MKQSDAFGVVVGESTKYLHKFVRWEIELALELGLPMVISNLNNKAEMDPDRCPAILRDVCAIHVPFKKDAIKYVLENFPRALHTFSAEERAKGWRYYNRPEWYKSMGLYEFSNFRCH
ncbi:TIR domain-containing protein [Bradyrhizobium septentrionale]|uniref:TIR domain-containing protein n=1 Tax=Bradyrhizobium septentrionale TaxID=1404411 RepID=UPI001F1888EB|nr:TIR domain-containing protein [Bradyrhizobium septentrionale]